MPKTKAWAMLRMLRVGAVAILGSASLYYLSAGLWFMNLGALIVGGAVGVFAFVFAVKDKSRHIGSSNLLKQPTVNGLLSAPVSPSSSLDRLYDDDDFWRRRLTPGTVEYYGYNPFQND
ncbi:hypothetical protein ACN9JG_22850 (plasmid) [Cereibacter azotoformans]|uniref:hypothetical protein n=1 Tax=Cereibacter azotoformans TaxID=43057 RepID=UPI003B220A12